jgi:hypothetical protein
MDEIVALEEQRLASRLGQGVREAVAEIQASLMAASLPEIPVRLAGDMRLLACHRRDAKAGCVAAPRKIEKIFGVLAAIGAAPPKIFCKRS